MPHSLIAVSALASSDAIGRIMAIEGHGNSTAAPPENINATVMFSFTLGNLLIDSIATRLELPTSASECS